VRRPTSERTRENTIAKNELEVRSRGSPKFLSSRSRSHFESGAAVNPLGGSASTSKSYRSFNYGKGDGSCLDRHEELLRRHSDVYTTHPELLPYVHDSPSRSSDLGDCGPPFDIQMTWVSSWRWATRREHVTVHLQVLETWLSFEDSSSGV
jgi:hypothetical protein